MILEEIFNGKFYPCETVVSYQRVADAVLMDFLW